MIKLTNISKYIDNEAIIKNFNYTFELGKTYCITGKSGSGKSTLLNIISLLDNKFDGEIEFENINKSRLNIGYMFQNYGLISSMTVKQNLKIICKSEQDILKTLTFYGLEDKLNVKISSLSGGEAQRIAFVKLVLKKPQLIICDEPTGNLDNENRDVIFNALLNLQTQNNIIICVTHDQSLVEKIPNKIKLIR